MSDDMVGRAHDERLLFDVLTSAEGSARQAVRVLIEGLPTPSPQATPLVEPLIHYATRCPDPFVALDLARPLRAMLDDLDSSVYSRGGLTEWAYAELRMTALTARVTRALRDERALDTEQALVDLAVLHLHALEDSPRYSEILAEMARIQSSQEGVRPRAPVQEFFGLARGTVQLPTGPPPGGPRRQP